MDQPTQDAPACPLCRMLSVRRMLNVRALVVVNLILLAVLAGLVVADVQRTRRVPPSFSVVEPGRLYRSGQPSAEQFASIIQQYGIRTVINLRNADREPAYVADEPLVQPYGVRVVRLPISSTTPLSADELATLRALYADPHNYPILVHCEQGHARTGVAVALWRIERQGWDPAKAVQDMVACGYPVRPESDQMRGVLLHWNGPADKAKKEAP